MKWPPNKGYINHYLQKYSYQNYSVFNITSQVAKMIFCLTCTGMFLSGDSDLAAWRSSHRPRENIAAASTQKIATNISQVASNISVRILNQDFLGSGFIVQRHDQEYLVITNQHVLRAGKAPYTIETVDGSTYRAKVITKLNNTPDQYDLAILKFTADLNYQTAKIGSSLQLQVGQSVFAAGFPSQESSMPKTASIFQSNIFSPRELTLESGRVAIILPQALAEGYQIGYTNDVKKGMSGGPLFNAQGEVIGINGKHAYPLWESPEIYQDGSELCPALQSVVTRSSLAIPIEKIAELTNQLKPLKSTEHEAPVSDHLSAKEQRLVTKMQSEAAENQLQCSEQDQPKFDF